MAARADNQAIAFSEKVFLRLLAAYPKTHREEYGAAMAQLFRDECRDAWSESRGWGLTKLWLRVLPDIAATSFSEHLEAIKERKFMLNRISTLFRSVQSFKFFTVFTAVFLLVVITATIVTFILPESFLGTARILVRMADDSSKTSAKNEQSATGDYDPYFIQTEFEVMQSQAVLVKVVQQLNLREKWGIKFHSSKRLTTDEAIVFLKHSMDVRPVRNTSLIEIRAYSDKPDEAANLANAVAEAYCDYRLERNREKMEQGMKVRREELAKRQLELRAAEDEVDGLRAELKVSDTDPQSAGPSPILNDSAVRQSQGDVIRLESEAVRLETQLDKLKSLPREKLRGVIPSVGESDSMLTMLLTELDVAEQNALKLKSTVTEDHSDYKTAKQQVETLNKKIDDRVDNILFGLETRLASTKAYIESMTDKLAKAKHSDIENTARTRPYWEAKRKLAELIQFQNVLQMKLLASEETDLQLPKLSAVEILDRQTTPNLTPVRPNKPLNIILGVVLGIVFGLIAAAGTAGISFLSRRNAPPKIAS